MYGSYIQQRVRCPFYLGDDGKLFVRCEGLDDDSSLRLQFRRKRPWGVYVARYCCRRYERCWLYAMLTERKYAEHEKKAAPGIEKSETAAVQWTQR